MNLDWLFWTNTTLIGLLIISISAKILFLWNELKPRTYALLLDPDKKTRTSKRVNTKKHTFVYDGGEYNITKPWIKIGNRKLLLYETNKADPINPLDAQNSRLDADTYHDIMENRVLQILNKGQGLFGNMSIKQVALYGVIGAVGLYILSTYL